MKEAKAYYAMHFVGIDEYVATGVPDGGRISQFEPYQGKYKRPLGGASFYDAVGRPDLAATYRSRATLRTVLLVGGAAVSLVGISYASGVLTQCDGPDSSCATTRTTIGLSVMGAGLVMGLVSLLIDPEPVSRDEMRHLATTYDSNLRRKLHLETSREEKRPRWALGFTPKTGGGALVLAWNL